MQSTDTPQLTTDETPVHTVRETLRSVELPTAASPFGPVRKREKPPVGVPGQRKPSDSTARPTQPATRGPVVTPFNRGAYDEAFTALQRDGYGNERATVQDCFAPAAWREAFGAA